MAAKPTERVIKDRKIKSITEEKFRHKNVKELIIIIPVKKVIAFITTTTNNYQCFSWQSCGSVLVE